MIPVPTKEQWIDRYAEIFGKQPNKEMIDFFEAAARCTWQEIVEELALRSKELEV